MGESLTIVSTVFWTLHITYTDMATEYVDSISMMCIQLGVVTFLSCLAALLLEVSGSVFVFVCHRLYCIALHCIYAVLLGVGISL